MKTPFKLFLLYILTSCCCNIATAQTTTAPDSLLNKKLPDSLLNKKEIEFPTLAAVIDSALKHNAAVRYRNLEIEVRAYNLTIQRNVWLRNLGVQADSRYGTIDAFSTNANGVTSNFANTTSKQLNYAAGVYLKIPIFDIVNRKTQIKQAKAELEEAKSQAASQEDDIRQLVIKQYEDLLMRQKLLIIKSQNQGSATVNMEMVEKEFRNGVIPITEYVRLSDMTSRIQADYEIAKSEFLLSKKLLEDIAGFTFGNPDTREK
jgi:outer membrane protein TolC